MLQITFYPVTSVVTGIPFNSELETFFTTQLSYVIPDAENHPHVKRGEWDGRVSVMQRYYPHTNTHTLPTGIVQRFLRCADMYKLPCTFMTGIQPLLPDPSLAYLQANQTWQLRDYQQKALEKAVTGYELEPYGIKHPRTGGVQHICTGGGKSALAAKIIQHLQNKAVVLVQSGDLLEQMLDDLKAVLGEEGVGFIGDGTADVKDVNVCMVQSLHRYYKMKTAPQAPGAAPDKKNTHKWETEIQQLLQQTRVVIFDEVHGVAARQPFEVLSMFGNAAHVTGLSASPWRDDGTGILIECACGPVVEHVSATELINAGWLVPPTIYVHELPVPEGAAKYGDYDTAYKTFILDCEPRHNYIARLANSHLAKGDVTLVLVKFIEHGEALQQRIPGSVFVEGKLAKTKRKKLWQKVRDGELKCIIATSLADQGLNIPVLDTLILAGAGKSSTRALQRVGRVLRKPEGSNKTQATVHEIADAHSILKAHTKRRIGIYTTEPAFKFEVVTVKEF
jgi:superfamily II DNA or RNA helicase